MIITKEMDAHLSDTTMTWGSPIFLNTQNKPFKFYGFCSDFIRVPDEIAKNTNPGVEKIAKYSSGCRLRFKTNSDYIVVRYTFNSYEDVFTMTRVATCGFDMYFYENGKYIFKGAFNASQGDKPYYEARIKLDNFDTKDVLINLPVVASIKELYVALREGSTLDYASKYKGDKSIVCYGSSIVQGIGCGRPGTVYSSMLSRRLDMDVINMGFGGAALGEEIMMNYLSNFDMCAFVYDYDHNAPNPAHLEKTHYRGYEIIRKKHPNIPIIMASKPDYHFSNIEENEQRRQIIISSYNKAISNGDKNVYFVDGSKFYPEEYREIASVDGCHPNDLGYLFMTNCFEKALRKALNI